MGIYEPRRGRVGVHAVLPARARAARAVRRVRSGGARAVPILWPRRRTAALRALLPRAHPRGHLRDVPSSPADPRPRRARAAALRGVPSAASRRSVRRVRRVPAVKVRRASGEAVCARCYVADKPLVRCSSCGRPAHVAARVASGPICTSCYRSANTAPCAFCGRRRPVSRRTARGAPVCPQCAFRRLMPIRICAACGESKRTRRRTAAGEPLCDGCYGRARRARP